MFKKGLLIVVAFVATFGMQLKADEGMWLLPLLEKLNIKTMQGKGLQLSAEDIYSVNKTSLKDAIIIFGGGCTGEMISDQGLILTNHHCGYGAIQYHSTVEHDYLKDGFWAKTKSDELYTPGLKATYLKKLEDVTSKVLAKVKDDMTEEERYKAIDKAATKIEKAAMKGNHYKARVQNYYGGNQYFLLVYEVFTDVRLVGTPPSSIGKYGADTDNWMWPRHTGDFSMFRVYAGKDNKPAEFSTANVPYKPAHHLPISLKGIEKGDYSMVMGYPGGTQRYMTSYGVKEVLDITHPNRIKIRGKRQEILMNDMQADPAVRIKYASKYARSSNYWKFSIGQSKGLKRLDIYNKKKQKEEAFTKWIAQDASRAKFTEALPLIKDAIEAREEYNHAKQYISECLTRGTEIIGFAAQFGSLRKMLSAKKPKQKKIDTEVEALKGDAAAFFKDYNMPTDRKVAVALFEMFAKDVPAKNQPEIFKEMNGDYKKYVDNIYDNSMFTSKEKVEAFLAKPTAEAIANDPAYVAAKSIFNKYYELRKMSASFDSNLKKGQRLWIAGVLAMENDIPHYPDANFTMRLTYGEVGDYSPRDAVHYSHFTTIEGLMEKEDPNNWEFVVPARLKELFENKDYGRYGENGTLPVCFTTNNDITGGNSGSPVINGKGELIGCAFDGNWEAMSGDIVFEDKLQKCICADIRYILFVVDKFAGAGHLVDEMTIVE